MFKPYFTAGYGIGVWNCHTRCGHRGLKLSRTSQTLENKSFVECKVSLADGTDRNCTFVLIVIVDSITGNACSAEDAALYSVNIQQLMHYSTVVNNDNNKNA
jgi:hypothetical protein